MNYDSYLKIRLIIFDQGNNAEFKDGTPAGDGKADIPGGEDNHCQYQVKDDGTYIAKD